MGFRIAKSFRVPGGFRLNVSKSGVGASWGVRGFRVGTGPRGSRMNVYIPGTGVGWSSSLGGAGRGGGGGTRVERAARVERRRLDAVERELARIAERERAAYEVAVFENRLALLTSLHKEAWNPWDWASVAATPAPAEPPYLRHSEEAATRAMALWQPKVSDKLLGRVELIRQRHHQAIEQARAQDWNAHQRVLAAHRQEVARRDWFMQLARGILAGDIDAYDVALEYLSPFAELTALGEPIEAHALAPLAAEARVHVKGPEILPKELLSLTGTGKLSRKKMPMGRFCELYQDHVCSVMFRIARELFALLPIEIALVHACGAVLDPATGHEVEKPLVTAAFTRAELSPLDFERIDPSSALECFPHAMEFKKGSGLQPVDELTLEDMLAAAGIETPPSG